MKKHHYIGWILGSVVLVLLVIRLALPYVIKNYINHALVKEPEFSGKVEDVSLHLLTGSIVLNQVSLQSEQNDSSKFDFSVKHLDMEISYLKLFIGKIQMNVVLDEPVLHFYVLKAPDKQAKSEKPTDIWQMARAMLLPIPVDNVTVHQGAAYSIDQTVKPQTTLAVTEIEGSAEDLQKPASEEQPLPAALKMRAKTSGDGDVKIQAGLNPLASVPTFTLQLELKDVQLNQIDFILQSYTDLKAVQGSFSFYLEAQAKDGKITGYMKPFFENVKVTLPEGKKSSAVKQMYKKLVNWLSKVLENNNTNQGATKIEFSGTIDDPDASLWSVVSNLVKNAFYKALVPGFDSSYSLFN